MRAITKQLKKRWYFLAKFTLIALAVVVVVLIFEKTTSFYVTEIKKSTAVDSNGKTTFNKQKYPTSYPTSIWVVVNKQNPISPIQYKPADLVYIGAQQVSSKIALNLQAMIARAKSEGITLRVISGYRSYAYQTSVYNSYVAHDGQAKADIYSAKPGYSEHQTGFAADIGGAHGCDLAQCFGTTPEGKWLQAHAREFGFIIRYTNSNRSITGYEAEPWHIRYVGKELVGEMNKQHTTTLEEFFGIPGGRKYSY